MVIPAARHSRICATEIRVFRTLERPPRCSESATIHVFISIIIAPRERPCKDGIDRRKPPRILSHWLGRGKQANFLSKVSNLLTDSPPWNRPHGPLAIRSPTHRALFRVDNRAWWLRRRRTGCRPPERRELWAGPGRLRGGSCRLPARMDRLSSCDDGVRPATQGLFGRQKCWLRFARLAP